jgi:TolA-binding protein
LPETLFTLAELNRQKGDTTQAEMYAKRLLEEFPGNGWAQKLKPVGTR